ncbi:MAG UNVERIFIED_CONTAM: hypothetical protein LVR18_21150 [Planctomycetaceae bacterium]
MWTRRQETPGPSRQNKQLKTRCVQTVQVQQRLQQPAADKTGSSGYQDSLGAKPLESSSHTVELFVIVAA